MPQTQNRRVFLQTSVAALALGGTSALASSPPSPAAEPTNPRVRPGRVTWHDDFAAARAASERSGKPVLLFHMLGRMDERFC